MINLESYYSRRYDKIRYNCLHFARDIWRDLTGLDITNSFEHLFDPHSRLPKRHHFKSFRRLIDPVSPCLALFTRPKTAMVHIGIFLSGKILHIRQSGVEYIPLEIASLGFKNIRFYV